MENIVKVQRSMCGNKVLIYNKDQSIMYEGPYQKAIRLRQGGKKYSYYSIKGTIINIGSKAPDQDW